MYTVNERINIIASDVLARLKLAPLAGRTGVIVENLTQNRKKNCGYMVLLQEPYDGEHLWFIPWESIEAADEE